MEATLEVLKEARASILSTVLELPNYLYFLYFIAHIGFQYWFYQVVWEFSKGNLYQEPMKIPGKRRNSINDKALVLT